MKNFDQVVFAGGGNRCWWQAGFWHALNEKYPQAPERIVAISAGAATACLLYARPGKEGAQWALQYYEDALCNVTKNVHWENIWSDQKVFPHNAIYSKALSNILAKSPENLKNAPDIYIGVAHIPKWLGPKSAVFIGLLAYNLEKYVLKNLHPKLGRCLGFKREFVKAQDCKNLKELQELILQSSCTPPFTPVMYRNHHAVLDGGLVDNVPIDGLAPSQNGKISEVLVLVTRRYPFPDVFVRELPGLRLTYVQPTKKVVMSSWDYSRSELMRPTYQQGHDDAQLLLDQIMHVAVQHAEHQK
jgi:predicted acylesterase/phospholipase RssA